MRACGRASALDAQAPHDLIWIRDEFLNWREDFGMMIVHGHTPVAEPELRPNRVNVDTGAFATGRLTCAVIEGSDDQLRVDVASPASGEIASLSKLWVRHRLF